jgi:predicted RNA-binding protein with PUA-like domain
MSIGKSRAKVACTGSFVHSSGMPTKRSTEAAAPRHWLMKSEPAVFGFDHLWDAPKRTTAWSGVRNYLARNYMREMRTGDLVLFYHSSAKPTGVAGIAEIARTAYPDATAFDAKDDAYDPKSTREAPVWDVVDVRAKERFAHFVTLDALRAEPALADMVVLRRGNRLSVSPVTPEEFAHVERIGRGA